MEAPRQHRATPSNGSQCECCCSCCNSQTDCTAVLLGAVAAVLLVGGIFLAFHYWDYRWLIVAAVGAVLVLIAAAAPFCKQHRARHNRVRKYGSRGAVDSRRGEEEPLPSAPPLSSTSQLSLNMLPPFYGSGDDTSSCGNTGVALNHIVNIDGQSYLLLPIMSPTPAHNASNNTEANRRFSTALASLTATSLQVDLPSKRDCQLQTEPPTEPAQTVQDLLLPTDGSTQSTATEVTLLDCNSNSTVSEARAMVSDELPLLQTGEAEATGEADASVGHSAVPNDSIPPTSSDAERWIETSGSDVEDSGSLVEAVLPPSYEEVTKHGTGSITVAATLPAYGTL